MNPSKTGQVLKRIIKVPVPFGTKSIFIVVCIKYRENNTILINDIQIKYKI